MRQAAIFSYGEMVAAYDGKNIFTIYDPDTGDQLYVEVRFGGCLSVLRVDSMYDEERTLTSGERSGTIQGHSVILVRSESTKIAALGAIGTTLVRPSHRKRERVIGFTDTSLNASRAAILLARIAYLHEDMDTWASLTHLFTQVEG